MRCAGGVVERKGKGMMGVTGRQEEEVTTDFNILRWRLETKRKSLMEELERLKTNVSPWQGFYRVEEEANEILEIDNREAIKKRKKDLLTEVEHALHKFDSGTYGVCDNCGHAIDPARLEALPQVSLCFSCKEHQIKNTGVGSKVNG